MLSFSKKKWVWFSFLLVLVLSANVFIYRTDIIKPIPSEVVLGSYSTSSLPFLLSFIFLSLENVIL